MTTELADAATGRERSAVMTIDLNSDLGEGLGQWSMGNDSALLAIVTSANIACGFHAGDPSIMRRVTAEAAAKGVAIGAHVSYRDLIGFGRRFIDVDPDELQADVTYQLAALAGFARLAGSGLRYVKPHGALYNTIGHHREQATAVVQAIAEFDGSLPVLGLPGALWLDLAQQTGLRVAHEAFADRAYTAEGTLVSRRLPGSVLHDPERIAARCVAMATGQPIEDVDGNPLSVQADSVCVHGDTAGAVEIARHVKEALQAGGIEVRPFTF